MFSSFTVMCLGREKLLTGLVGSLFSLTGTVVLQLSQFYTGLSVQTSQGLISWPCLGNNPSPSPLLSNNHPQVCRHTGSQLSLCLCLLRISHSFLESQLCIRKQICCVLSRTLKCQLKSFIINLLHYFSRARSLVMLLMGLSESSVKWDSGNSSLVLKHHSLGSSCRLQILHLLFQFYLEFLLIDKFLAQLNIVCFQDGTIQIDFYADEANREVCSRVVNKGYVFWKEETTLKFSSHYTLPLGARDMLKYRPSLAEKK